MFFVTIGDSMVQGGILVPQSQGQLLSEKYPKMQVVNLGVGGDTTAGIESRKEDADKYNPFRVIVWGGINDVALSVSAATIEANLQSIYTYYSGQGYEVWALTITPRDDNTAPMIAVRDAVNTWIKTTATGVTKVIDAFAIVADPTNTDVRLPAYADETTPNHLNQDGHNAIVNSI